MVLSEILDPLCPTKHVFKFTLNQLKTTEFIKELNHTFLIHFSVKSLIKIGLSRPGDR